MSLMNYLARFIPQLEAALEERLNGLGHRYTPELLEAIGWTPRAGGKRLRPAVLERWQFLASGKEFEASAFKAGVALELIHACSLVLDDLPAMDDARLRRAKPTCHLQFGEATAILAANSQLMLAFRILGELDGDHPGLGAVPLLADAVGVAGMVGGQHVDLELAGERRDLVALEYIHRHKTGILFEAAARLGVRLGKGDAALEEHAGVYARNLGLAFQVKDDLLDATGHALEMGKDARQDQGKPTFVEVLGQGASERILHELLLTAHNSLEGLGKYPEELSGICQYVEEREK